VCIKTLFIMIIGKLFVECICSQKCYLFEVGDVVNMICDIIDHDHDSSN